MGILDIASAKSIWRGYDYYKNNRVISCDKISDAILEGVVQGSDEEQYQVAVDIPHAKRSTCTCPHAEGTRRICKHKIAVYFTAFPEEAQRLIEEAQAYEEEQERMYEDIEELITKYLRKQKKSDLVDLVYELLITGPEWQLDRFIRDYIE